ncbi:MAG TPA: hypothetical protein DDX14_05490, partial [Cyanobacteria bacterium UBA9579]|nr:hypothetical protein [Cyanobacteria bacterium UBA9579]
GLAKKFGDQAGGDQAAGAEANKAGATAQPDLLASINKILDAIKGLVGEREALVATAPNAPTAPAPTVPT